MKTLIVLSIMLCGFASHAQQCPKFVKAMRDGNYYLKGNRSLDKALIEFQAAQVAARECGLNTNEPAEALVKVYNGLKKQVKDAEAAFEQAKKDRIAADNARKEAEEQKKISERTLGYFFKNNGAEVVWASDFSKKYGIINRKGELLGDGFVWDKAVDFTGDYAMAWRNDSLWFLNKAGEKISRGYTDVSKTEFEGYMYADEILISYNGKTIDNLFPVSNYFDINERRHSIIPFKKGNAYGFKDKKGVEVLPAKFDSVILFRNQSGNYSAARQSDRWHLIDLISAKMLPGTFASLADAKSNSFNISDTLSERGNDSNNRVQLDTSWRIVEFENRKGIIDFKGDTVLSPIYDNIVYFSGDSIFLLTEMSMHFTNRNNSIFDDDASGQVRQSDTKTMSNNTNTLLQFDQMTGGMYATFDTEIAFFNAATGLYYNISADSISHWWNGDLLIPGLSDGENPPKFDYSVYFRRDGKIVPTFNFLKKDIGIQNRKSSIIKTRSDHNNSPLLSHVGSTVNFRNTVSGLWYANEDRNSVYVNPDYWSSKQGLLKADGSVLTPPIYDQIYAPSEGKRLAKKNSRYGFIDSTGWIIPFVYDAAFPFSGGRANVVKDKKQGFIDHAGNVIIPIEYEDLHEMFLEGLVGAKLNGKWGFIDTTGRWKIAPVYDQVYGFHYGYASVEKEGKWGVINLKGKTVRPFTMEIARSPSIDGWARFKENGKWGFFNDKEDKIIQPKYDSVIYFRAGVAWVKLNGNWILIDENEKRVFESKDKKIVAIQPGGDGYSVVIDETGSHGLVDSLGQVVFEIKNTNSIVRLGYKSFIIKNNDDNTVNFFQPNKPLKKGLDYKNLDGDSFINGLAVVDNGIINMDGDYVLKGQYSPKLVAYRTYILGDGKKQGYVAFTDFGKGVTDSTKAIQQKRLLPLEYEEIGFPLIDEFLPVKQNGKWGFIQWVMKSDGTELPQLTIPCKYDAVVPFIKTRNNEKIAVVSKNNIIFFINERDEILFKIADDLYNINLTAGQ